MLRHLKPSSLLSFSLLTVSLSGQTVKPTATPATPARPTPPTRDPHTPGYVHATDLPDGTLPAPTADGNFLLVPPILPPPR